MTGLDAAVDAGAAMLVVVADAGAVGAGSVAAPVAASGFPEWLKIALTAGAGAGAIVTGVVSLMGWRFQTRIERMKHDLAAALTKQTLRTNYLRDQIEKLYGPLAFFVESSARHIATNSAILKAFHEYFSDRHSEDSYDEAKRTIETANRYMALVVENNKEAITVLRAGWGWLDADDIADAGQYLTDIARHMVEFEEGQKLPLLFYIESALKAAVGPPSFIRPAFIEGIRRKLREKQRELAGLTGAEVPASAGPPAAPVPNQG